MKLALQNWVRMLFLNLVKQEYGLIRDAKADSNKHDHP